MIDRVLPVTIVCLLLSPCAHAGSVIEFETRELGAGTPVTGIIRISTQGLMTRLDIESTDSGGTSTMMFRGDRDELIMIDHEEKRYFLIDKEQIDSLAGQVSDAMQHMEAALATMPPEQRAIAEKMMKDRMPAAAAPKANIAVVKTGGDDTIAGYDCDNYRVTDAGNKMLDLCVTPWDEIDGGLESAEALEEFSDYLSKMRESFPMMGGGGEQDMFAHMKSLGGYPVHSVNYNSAGQPISDSRILSASEEDIDPAAFEPPPDYARQKMR